jgi:RND family efflux transporter MFP subunit
MRRTGSRKSFARKLWLGLFVLAAAGAGVGLWGPWGKGKAPVVPTAEVRLGEFVDYVELRGEIRVRSSTVITAPYNAGDLQILKLCRDGEPIKKGDVVVQFDPTSLKRSADQYRSTLKQVEAEIQRANAQQRLREEQILTDVMSAQFGLDRARLDASTQDVISAIENEKNLLAVAKAEQKVREVETRITSSRVGAEADLAGTIRRRDKAQADLDQAERNMAALTLTSPVDGMITILPNSRARTSILGGTAPVFKEGDRTYAGAAIAEVPELSTIQANAPVYEADRGKVALGQPVTVRVDGVPDKEHKGRVGDVSTLAKLDYSSYPTRKSFDLTVRLEQPDPRLRPGMSANFRVEVERLPNSIVIPAGAVFDKGGRIIAYVLANGGFEERMLEIARRGDGQVLVARGLKQGERVALKDPTLPVDQR